MGTNETAWNTRPLLFRGLTNDFAKAIYFAKVNVEGSLATSSSLRWAGKATHGLAQLQRGERYLPSTAS